MFTDTTALASALAAIRISRRPATGRRPFGYHRFEILAVLNALLLFGVAIYSLTEAYQRFRSPAEVQATVMLCVAAFGHLINLISMGMLSGEKNSRRGQRCAERSRPAHLVADQRQI